MNRRIPTIDALRGIASLAVCWFHLSLNLSALPNGVVLKSVGDYGQYGVDVFFVISGFVIPYSLYSAGYGIRSFKTFFLKRIIRLDPPYILSLVLMILLGFATLKFAHYRIEAFNTSPIGLLLHLGYLNVIAGYPWINPVYWSLAIEFQYYLTIGLIFPMIAHENRLYRYATFLILGGSSILIRNEAFLPHWLLLFLLGIVTFNFMVEQIGKSEYVIMITILSIAVLLTMPLPIAIAGIATALVIAFVRINSRVLGFFGAISYSLYLLHTATGAKPIKLICSRFPGVYSLPVNLGILVFFTAVSVLAAYVFYRLIEKPSQQWSAKIKYRKSTPEAQPEFATAGASSVSSSSVSA